MRFRRWHQIALVTFAYFLLTIAALVLVMTRHSGASVHVVNLGPLMMTLQSQVTRTMSSLVIHTTIFDERSSHRARTDYKALIDGLKLFRAEAEQARADTRAVRAKIDAILSYVQSARQSVAAIGSSRLEANQGYNSLFGLDDDIAELSALVNELNASSVHDRFDQEQRFILELTALLVAAITLSGVIVALFWRDFGHLQNSFAELKKRSAELKVAMRTAEEASAAKSRFLATMSHEMRTPMNGVIGLSQLLLRGNLGDNERMFADKIYDSASALIQLINEVLDTSAIESGTLRINVQAFDLESLINAATGPFEALVHQKGLKLDIAAAENVPKRLHGDDQRVRQILQNLIGNALKFTEKGAIRLSISAPRPGQVRFRVMDTGAGIPADQIEKVFERFHQVDNSNTRSHGGTGLGLAICRELCFLMGGDIQLQSKVGEGSVFTVTLPLPSVPEQTDAPQADSADQQPAIPSDLPETG